MIEESNFSKLPKRQKRTALACQKIVTLRKEAVKGGRGYNYDGFLQLQLEEREMNRAADDARAQFKLLTFR